MRLTANADHPAVAPSGPSVWPVILVTLAAFIWFASGIFYGLPQELDPDEQLFVRGAGNILANRTLDPDWYGAPAQLLMYLLAATFAVVVVVGLTIGEIASLGDVRQMFLDDPSAFFAAGRAVCAMVAALCVPMMLHITSQLRIPRPWAWAAVALFVVSPMTVQYAGLIRMDFLQSFFNMASISLVLAALGRDRPRRALIGAGACVGFAVTSKFTGVIGALPVVAGAATLAIEGRMGWGRVVTTLAFAGLASLAAAFVTGPYLFIDMNEMLTQLAVENRTTHLSHTSPGFFGALWFYLSEGLPEALGLLGTLLAAAAVLSMLAERRTRILAIYALGYLVFISALNLTWARWTLPLIPVALIALAWGAAQILSRLACPRAMPALLGATFAIIGLPLAVQSAGDAAARIANSHTRIDALNWAQTNLPAGSRVLMEVYAPGISAREYEIFVTPRGTQILPWEQVGNKARPSGFFGVLGQWKLGADSLIAGIEETGIDYIMLGGWEERYQREAETYPDEISIYAALFERYPEVAAFLPRLEGILPYPGTPIHILSANAADQ
jgi:hypothetical protein